MPNKSNFFHCMGNGVTDSAHRVSKMLGCIPVVWLSYHGHVNASEASYFLKGRGGAWG